MGLGDGGSWLPRWTDAVGLLVAVAVALSADSVPIVVGSFIVAGVVAFLSVLRYIRNRNARALLTAFDIIVVVLAIVYVREVIQQRDLLRFEGVLYPATDNPIQHPGTCPDRDITADTITISLGSNVELLHPNHSIDVVTINGDTILSLSARNGGLFVDKLDLFDSNGKIIANVNSTLIGNKLWVKPDMRKDRPDYSHLTVFDDASDKVLGIFFESPTSIIINGVFRGKGKDADFMLTIKDELGAIGP